MSKSVDNRVVEMQFNNKNFEQNVRESLSTLEKLKSSLGNLTKSSKNFEDLGKAASKIDLSGAGAACDVVVSKFDLMGVATKRIMENIVDMAMGFVGKLTNVMKEFTLEPIKQGFDEYELKMGSIQTMMNAQDAPTLAEVNAELNKLNEYADKTIYSFSDMTSNIGKFTNAGVSLKDSVKAIQGVANVAAISGANTQEASRAMYNFAQALSAGYVKLIDWKSIENANMATVEFKNELIKTAVELGTVIEVEGMYQTTTTNAQGKVSDLFNATTQFNDALANQWMTTEVLTQTLQRYTDETTEIGKKAFKAATEVKTFSQMIDTVKEAIGTGWADTFEIVLGDYEEAKALWSGLYGIIEGVVNAQSKLRNDILRTWKAQGGRQDLIDAFANIGYAIRDLATPAVEAFNEVFNLSIGRAALKVINLTRAFKGFTQSLVPSDRALEGIKNTFVGFYTIVRELGSALGILADFTLRPIGSLIRSIAEILVVALGTLGKVIGVFSGSTKELRNNLKPLSDTWAAIVDAFSTKMADTAIYFLEHLGEVSSRVASVIRTYVEPVIRVFFGSLYLLGTNIKFYALEAFKMACETLGPAVERVTNALTPFTTKFKEFSSSLSNSIKGNVTDTLSKGFTTFSSKVSEVTSKLPSFSDILNKAVSGLSRFVSLIVSQLPHVLDLLGKVGEYGSKAFGWLATNIKTAALTGLYTALKGINAVFQITVAAAQAFREAIITAVGDVTAGIQNGLSNAGKAITDNPLVNGFRYVATVVGNVGATVINVVKSIADAVARAFNATTSQDVLNYAKAFASLGSVRVLMDLANAVKKSLGEFTKISAGINGVLDGAKNLLNGITDALSRMGKEVPSNTIIKIAVAVGILTASMYALSRLDSEQILWSLGAITAAFGILLGAFTAFTKIAQVLEKKGGLVDMKTTASLVLMAGAVFMLAGAVYTLADLDLKKLAVGTTGVVVLLAALTGVVYALGKIDGKSMLLSSAAIIAFATGVKKLSASLILLSGLDWDELAKGIVGLGAVFMGLAIFIEYAGKANWKSLLTVLPMLIGLTIALYAMVGVMVIMSKLDVETIENGFLRLGILLTGLVVFMQSVSNLNAVGVASTLLALSVSLYAIIGVLVILGKLDFEVLNQGLFGLGAMLLELGITMQFLKGIDTSQTAVSLLALAVSLRILVPVIERIGYLNLGTLAQGLIGVGIALAEMVAVTRLMGSGSVSGAQSMILLAIALNVLVPGLKALADLGLPRLIISIGGLAAAMFVLGATAVSLQFALFPLSQLAKIIMLIGAGCLMAGVGVAAFSLGLISLAAAFGGSVLAMAAALKATLVLIADSLPFIAQKLGEALLAFLGAITGKQQSFSDAFFTLIQAGLDAIVRSSGMLAETLLRVIVEVLDQLVTYAPIIVNKVMDFLVIVFETLQNRLPELVSKALPVFQALIEAIADAISSLNLVDATKLAAIFVEFGIVFKLLAKMGKDILKGAFVLTSMIAVFGILGLVIVKLKDMGLTADVVPIVDSMTSTIVSLGILAMALNLFKIQPANAIQAALSLTALVGVFLILGLVISLLTHIGVNPELAPIIDSIANTIVKLGLLMTVLQFVPVAGAITAVEAIAIFVGGLTALLVALGAIAQIPGVQWLLSEGANVLTQLGDAIGGFAAAIVTKVGQAVSSLLPQIGSDLSAFMTNAQVFFDGLDKLGPNLVGGMESLLKAMLLLTASDIIAGWRRLFGFLTGGNSLETLGAELAAFAPHLVTFYENVQEIKDTQALLNAAEAAKALVEFAKAVPNEGGWLGKIFGENDIEVFGSKLAEFGGSLVEFANSVEGLKVDGIYTAVDAATALTELANKIPNEGGLIATFTGDNDFASFGENISAFGTSLVDFADGVDGLKVEAINVAADATQRLIDMANLIPNDGGLITIFSGDNDFATFGFNLVSFGQALVDFTVLAGAIDVSVFSAVVTEIENLTKIAESINSIGTTTFTDFVNDFNHLAYLSIDEFIKSYANGEIRVRAAINSFLAVIISTVDSKSSVIITSFTNLVDQILVKLESKIRKFEEVGGKYGTGVSDGFDKAKSAMIRKLLETIQYVINNSLKKSTTKAKFEEAGKYAAEGYAKGIDDNKKLAAMAGEAMVKATLAAIQKAQDSHSPSKETHKLGNDAGEGYIEGIADYQELSYYNGYKLAEEALDGAEDATEDGIEDLEDIILEGQEDLAAIEPVKIDPVTIDLTKVEKDSEEALRGMEVFMSKLEYQQQAQMQGIINSKVARGMDQLTAFLEARAIVFGETYNNVIEGLDYSNLKVFSDEATAAINGFMDSITLLQRIRMNDVMANLMDTEGLGYIEAFTKARQELFGANSVIVTLNEDAVKQASLAASTTAVTAADATVAAINDKAPEFAQSGEQMAEQFILGLQNRLPQLAGTMEKAVLEAYRSAMISLSGVDDTNMATNEELGDALSESSNGTKEATDAFVKVCEVLCNSGIDKIKDQKHKFYNAGQYIADGLEQGIRSKINAIAEAAAETVRRAIEAARAEAAIASPSKKTFQIGQFFGLGFVNGVAAMFGAASDVGKSLSATAIDAVGTAIAAASDLIDSDMEFSPTITPLMDLSSVESSLSKLNGMVTRNSVMAVSGEFNANRAPQNGEDTSQNGQTVINNFDMTQNNYSPKALSRTDIYRQTRNQFSQLKGVVATS